MYCFELFQSGGAACVLSSYFEGMGIKFSCFNYLAVEVVYVLFIQLKAQKAIFIFLQAILFWI